MRSPHTRICLCSPLLCFTFLFSSCPQWVMLSKRARELVLITRSLRGSLLPLHQPVPRRPAGLHPARSSSQRQRRSYRSCPHAAAARAAAPAPADRRPAPGPKRTARRGAEPQQLPPTQLVGAQQPDHQAVPECHRAQAPQHPAREPGHQLQLLQLELPEVAVEPQHRYPAAWP